MPKGVYEGHKAGTNLEPLKQLTELNAADLQRYKDFAAARRKNRVYHAVNLSERIRRAEEIAEERGKTGKPFTIGEIMIAAEICNNDIWARIKAGEKDYLIFEYIDLNGITEESCLYTAEGTPYVEARDEVTGQVVEFPLSLYSERLEKIYKWQESILEGNLYKSRNMPTVTGSIFGLKNTHKWSDQPQEAEKVSRQTLIIADKSQAMKALDMLREDD